MKVNVSIDLTTAQAGDIAIAAAEGGIGYWAILDEYHPSRWTVGLTTQEVPTDFVFYTIEATTDGDDLDDLRDECVKRDVVMELRVTPALIALGIERYLHAGGTFNDGFEFEMMDAMEADMVIQYGVFGEVVFG